MAVKGKRKPVRVYELIEAYQYLEDTTIQEVLMFNHAMDLFFQRRFVEALADFLQYKNIHPEDPSCNQHIDTCNLFISNPPGLEWDGSIRMTEK